MTSTSNKCRTGQTNYNLRHTEKKFKLVFWVDTYNTEEYYTFK